MRRRPIVEWGGVLLIGRGLSQVELAAYSRQLYASSRSLSVLIDAEQQKMTFQADEVWVFDALGLRGFLALIRRMSWRGFAYIYCPPTATGHWLRFFVWPRPLWKTFLLEDE